MINSNAHKTNCGCNACEREEEDVHTIHPIFLGLEMIPSSVCLFYLNSVVSMSVFMMMIMVMIMMMIMMIMRVEGYDSSISSA